MPAAYYLSIPALQLPSYMTERIAYSPREVCQMLGIGKTTFWRWARQGKIEVANIGRRAFVPTYVLTHLFEWDRMGPDGTNRDRPTRVKRLSGAKKGKSRD